MIAYKLVITINKLRFINIYMKLRSTICLNKVYKADVQGKTIKIDFLLLLLISRKIIKKS